MGARFWQNAATFMRPKKPEPDPTHDLFRMRLENMLDQRHPLVRLAARIDWSVFEEQWSAMFEPTQGRPAISPRLVAGLLYLKAAYDLSDEAVVERWVENPYFQHFCGEEFFQHEVPCHPSSLTRWRHRIGEEGCEWLLSETVEVAKRAGLVKRQSLERVTVDTTVLEKAIRYPTDARLYDRSRERLVKLARHCGVKLRQSYARVGPRLLMKVGRYGHARQMQRKRRATKRLKTLLGRVVRDIERKLDTVVAGLRDNLEAELALARRLLAQERNSKNKLYSLHAPEVECLSKGKVHKRWEFGVKASLAVTNREGFVIGARSFTGNPYDGHTLAEQLEQVEILTAVKPKRCYVDRGYRGHGVDDVAVYISGQRRGVDSWSLRRELRRRSAIEPGIGHMKNDGSFDRCWLKGTLGDAMHVVLCACGHNIRLLLNHLRRFSWAWLATVVMRVQVLVLGSSNQRRIAIQWVPAGT